MRHPAAPKTSYMIYSICVGTWDGLGLQAGTGGHRPSALVAFNHAGTTQLDKDQHRYRKFFRDPPASSCVSVVASLATVHADSGPIV